MGLTDELQSTTRFARLHHMLSCESTQAHSMADRGGDSAIFWSDHQTAGRGRHGRIWNDTPSQDVTATFRLTELTLPSPTLLAAAIPVAVARAIAEFVPDVTIKWPNDVLLRGRKLCGILIDTEGHPPHTYHVGIGLNVNRASFPPELADRSTSLALATGTEFDREAILLRLARATTEVTDQLINGDLSSLVAEFRARLGLVGQAVRATTGETECCGILTDLDLCTATLDHTQRISLAHLHALTRQ